MSEKASNTSYQSALKRIERAETIIELEKLEHALDWLYEIDVFSAKEISKLNGKIRIRGAQIEVNNNEWY